MWNRGYLLAKEPDQRLLENTLSLLDHVVQMRQGCIQTARWDSSILVSIIDHSGGKQPFTIGSDGPILIFNGEIFNYQALRRDLEVNSERFITDSDTEVLYVLLRLDTAKLR